MTKEVPSTTEKWEMLLSEASKLACKIRASRHGEFLTLPPTASQMYFPEV